MSAHCPHEEKDLGPTSSLDRFIHTFTQLPCSLFLVEGPSISLQDTWVDAVQSRVRSLSHYPDVLLRQLWEVCHPESRSDAEPPAGIQAICAPARTRYLYELHNGCYGRRTHIEKLIRLESSSLASTQLVLLTTAILQQFPPDGLQTNSATELTDLFLLHVVHMEHEIE